MRGHKGISWPKFFRRVSVKTEAKRRLDGIETQLKKQRTCLARAQAPEIEPGSHCHSPVSCEYWVRCTELKPTDWVFHLPHLNSSRRDELRGLGIEAISAIPDEFRLSLRQRIIRDVTRSRKPYVAAELFERLRGFGPPAFYLDFEAFLPAVPLYRGTRPYQTIPFQWSLHHVDPVALTPEEQEVVRKIYGGGQPEPASVTGALAAYIALLCAGWKHLEGLLGRRAKQMRGSCGGDIAGVAGHSHSLRRTDNLPRARDGISGPA